MHLLIILFTIGRIILGGYFVYNAYGHFAHIKNMTGYTQSKGVPLPKFAVLLTGLMLLFGGLSILFEKYTTAGLWLLVIFFIGVTYKMHQFWKATDPMAKMTEQIQFTKNLALLGALLMLLALSY